MKRNESMIKSNVFTKVISTTVVAVMLTSTIAYGAEPLKKTESVYVNLTPEGMHKQTIVSDWIHSSEAGVEIKDKSILQAISNIKGDETPDVHNEVLIWKSDKNDIYYQGYTNEPLPLEVKITYFLDGKEISPEDLAGKSGQVKVNLKLINKDSHVVSIGETPRNIYTPFIATAVVNLPLDTFTKVTASSGEIISDANNQVVTFIGFPGLQESLDIDEDLLELPEEVTIEAQAHNFEMGPIMIAATPQFPDMDGFESAGSMDELQDGIEKMKDATSQLAEGSEKLAQGQGDLSQGIEGLYSGMGQLRDASGAINIGASQLAKGADDALAGSNMLAGGVTQMGQGVQEFGAAALLFGKGSKDYAKGAMDFATGAADFANQLAPLTGKVQELGSGLNAMADNTPKIIAGVEGITAGAEQGAHGAQALKAAKGKQDAGIDAVLNGLNATIAELESVPGTEKALGELKAYKQILSGIQGSKGDFDGGMDTLIAGFGTIGAVSGQLTDGLKELQEGQLTAANGVAQMGDAEAALRAAVQGFRQGSKGLEEGAKELAKNAELLNKGAGQFGSKMKDFESGFNEFNGGITKLRDGARDLYSGSTEFDNGLNSAYDGVGQLDEGAKELASGSDELSVNMKKFDEEGVGKLEDEAKEKLDDIDHILEAKDEVVKLSKDYGTFSGLDESMEGSVKFIMKTDEIKAPEAEKVTELKVDDEKQSLWDKIKNLFSKGK